MKAPRLDRQAILAICVASTLLLTACSGPPSGPEDPGYRNVEGRNGTGLLVSPRDAMQAIGCRVVTAEPDSGAVAIRLHDSTLEFFQCAGVATDSVSRAIFRYHEAVGASLGGASALAGYYRLDFVGFGEACTTTTEWWTFAGVMAYATHLEIEGTTYWVEAGEWAIRVPRITSSCDGAMIFSRTWVEWGEEGGGTEGGGGGSGSPPPNAPPVLLSSLAMGPATTATVTAGSTYSGLVVTATFSNGQIEDVTTVASWSSSDPNVVSLGDKGSFYSNAPGTAVLSATFLGTTTSLAVTVTGPYSDDEVEGEEVDPCCGKPNLLKRLTFRPYQHAWCDGAVPGTTEMTPINQALARMRAKGGDCSLLADSAAVMISNGRIRLFARDPSTQDFYGFNSNRGGGTAGGTYILLDREFVTTHPDSASARTTSTNARTLQELIAHEVQHALGYGAHGGGHISNSVQYTSLTRSCGDYGP